MEGGTTVAGPADTGAGSVGSPCDPTPAWTGRGSGNGTHCPPARASQGNGAGARADAARARSAQAGRGTLKNKKN